MRFEPDKLHNPSKSPADKEKGGLASMLQQRKKKILGKRGDKYLHSKEHLLADDLSRMMGEQKRFASYLGIAKLHYESDLRALARYVLEKENLPREARGRYFFGAVRNLEKIPGAKLKPRKKKAKKKSSHPPGPPARRAGLRRVKETNGKKPNRKRAE